VPLEFRLSRHVGPRTSWQTMPEVQTFITERKQTRDCRPVSNHDI
jgi:hypothetical protein